MALQYSTISVEPAPGYGVHNPGPSSTDGFAMRPGAKVFAPEAQLDFHLDVAVSLLNYFCFGCDSSIRFFSKGSVVTIVQVKITMTPYTKCATKNHIKGWPKDKRMHIHGRTHKTR